MQVNAKPEDNDDHVFANLIIPHENAICKRTMMRSTREQSENND